MDKQTANSTPGTLTAEGDQTQKHEFLWNVHTYTNNYIQFADTKAAFCVAIASALMAALFASKAQELFINKARSPFLGSGAFWATGSLGAFLLLATSMLAAVLVVLPRPWHRYSTNVFIFWDDIINEFQTAALFAQRYGTQTDANLTDCLSQHIYSLAQVCHRKYLWVSVATVAAALGGAVAIVVLLFK